MVAISAIGLGFLLLNADLPIVRNSFLYAKSARLIIDNDFNPLPIIADRWSSFGKPIAFPYLLAVVDRVFGDNVGPKVGSFLGGVLFLFAARAFFCRVNPRIGIHREYVPLQLALLFASPLVFYQFWSAHPDILFGAEVLAAFVLLDIIVHDRDRDTRPHILALGVLLYATILTKLFGVILLVMAPVYLAANARQFFAPSAFRKAKLLLMLVVFSGLGGALVLAALGHNPIHRFMPGSDNSDGGFGGYLAGLKDPAGPILDSFSGLGCTLLLCLGAALLFLFRASGCRRRIFGLASFFGVYVLALLPFPSTDSNMRYFIPALPFVVVLLVYGFQETRSRLLKNGLLAAHFAGAVFLTLDYNVPAVHELSRPFNETWIAPLDAGRYQLDNLRLPQHLETAQQIREINEVVEPDGFLVWVSVYYMRATHGFAKALGVRDDITVEYVIGLKQIPRATRQPIYITLYSMWADDLSDLDARFDVDRLGEHTYSLTRAAPR